MNTMKQAAGKHAVNYGSSALAGIAAVSIGRRLGVDLGDQEAVLLGCLITWVTHRMRTLIDLGIAKLS